MSSEQELIQDIDTDEPIVVVPNIEQNIAIPKNQKEAMPDISLEDEIQLRAETIKVMSDIKGDPLDASAENREQANQLAIEMMENPEVRPEFGNYPNETMAYLAGMVAQSNCHLVKTLSDYKLYVLNNAVKAHETTDSVKEKLQALRMIGEVDGVDAFKKKTEVTHFHKSGKELEEELRRAIEDLKGKMIQGEHKVIEDKDDD